MNAFRCFWLLQLVFCAWLHAGANEKEPSPLAIRIGTVDLGSLYNNHPKTKVQVEKLQAVQKSAEKDLDRQRAEGVALVEKYRELTAQAKNSALPAEDRSKATAQAAALAETIKLKQDKLRSDTEASRISLGQQLAAFRQGLLKEISLSVRKQALSARLDIVLDVSATSPNGICPILYADPGFMLGGEQAKLAQPRPRLVTVNLARLYDHNSKAKAQLEAFEAEALAIQKEVEQINAEGMALVSQYKLLTDQAKDSTLSAEAQLAAKSDAEGKLQEIIRKRNEKTEYLSKNSSSLEQRRQAFRRATLQGIALEVVTQATQLGANLIVDTSAPSTLGVSNITYSSAAYDLEESQTRGKANGVETIRTVDLVRLLGMKIAPRSLLDEVSQKVAELARQKEMDLVLDLSGLDASGVPLVVFANPKLELTSQIRF